MRVNNMPANNYIYFTNVYIYLYTYNIIIFQSSTSSNSSGEERERRRLQTEEDVDAICVQQTESCAEDEATAQLQPETTELDGGLKPPPQQYGNGKEESSCGLDCITFTMQCCECTIL